MSTLHLSWMNHPPSEFTGGAITIGNFDGVHLGHQALVQATARTGSPAIVVTFDPPPGQLLFPGPIRPPLSTLDDRSRWLHEAGADHVVYLRTDAGLLSLSPEAFVEDVIVGLFRAKAVVEGANFHFGRGRAGNGVTLRTVGPKYGFAFSEVPVVVLDDEAVSSSRVRTAIQNGDVSLASKFLGRAYSVCGTVVTGARRGRTIGFPTANLEGVETLLPKEGVYAVRAIVNGVKYSAAANIGPNPTFGEDARKLEVHLLDFTGDIYGRSMNVEFVARLRETRPFAGVPNLIAQLNHDVETTRRLLAT